MGIATVGLGFMVLLAGRPLYPVFTGVATFLVGMFLVQNYVALPRGWDPIIVYLFMAALGFGAGFAFRRWLAYAAALVAGAYLVYYLPIAVGARAQFASPILAIAVGVICMIAAFVIFDASLVVITALTGTTMILQYLKVGYISPVVLFVILVVFSIITQFLMLQYATPTPD